MNELMWEIENADGTRGYVRNPFALGADTSKQQELRKLKSVVSQIQRGFKTEKSISRSKNICTYGDPYDFLK